MRARRPRVRLTTGKAGKKDHGPGWSMPKKKKKKQQQRKERSDET
jgi:hypothetical protein